MIKRFNKLTLGAIFLFAAINAAAQSVATNNQPVQMADGMRSNGKIYVVVAVLVTVLAGLFLYLVRLEKRIKQIENSETIHMP
jgi:hypothetical protein